MLHTRTRNSKHPSDNAAECSMDNNLDKCRFPSESIR